MEWGEYMQSLNETKAGESYTIKWMTGMPETMEQIRQYDVSEKRRNDNSFGEGIVLSGCFREDVMRVWEQKSNFFQK